MSSETINYYNQNAADFAAATDQIDMTALYQAFLPLVKTGGHILDAGCGSGRDAAYFKQLGFSVSAFDASSELAKIASQRLKQPVTVQQFEQLNDHELYDGIWCCASLLHVPADNLVSVLGRLQQALKPKAVLYASFKYGDSEREVNGRRFTDMNEEKLKSLVATFSSLSISKAWLTQDQRPERSQECWLNALLFKDEI
ncbi:class I SAM-dependent methyltransferase [Rheinheimera aquimaris]|uniref:class I SAM-dependent methyltransferase n=1 Tax=Rheinheimera aquimaris TaxID=412437 RepID=UPI001064A4B7|nr:class I SAM-dependent methyltransferase [Rheinheimera aquimaris]|tara:strand:+ start:1865 stop:2461 length:597 start_codon:yes stop_codon:yes gene_type:complete